MEVGKKSSLFEDEFSSTVLLPSADDHNETNEAKYYSASNAIHVTCFSNYMAGLNGFDELASSFNHPFMLTEENPASSKPVDIYDQGDTLDHLLEKHDHFNEKYLKMEEVLGLPDGLMQPGIYSSVRDSFSYQGF